MKPALLLGCALLLAASGCDQAELPPPAPSSAINARSGQPAGHPTPKPALKRLRNRRALCFGPLDLQTSAGPLFVDIRENPSSRRRLLAELVNGNVSDTIAHNLRIAQRYVPTDRREALARVDEQASLGLRVLQADPSLLIDGHVAGFKRARKLAEASSLARCGSR